MQLLSEVIAELMALNFFNFMKMKVIYGNLKWVDTFFFAHNILKGIIFTFK